MQNIQFEQTKHKPCYWCFFPQNITDLKFILNTKVVNSEECVSQHKHYYVIRPKFERARNTTIRRKIWKLKNDTTKEEYKKAIEDAINQRQNQENQLVDQLWYDIKSILIGTTDNLCGKTKGGMERQRITWWWTDEVSNSRKTKRKLWKEWKTAGSKEVYLLAKKHAKRTVYHAKKEAEKSKIKNLESKEGKNYIFTLAKQLKHEN